MKNFARWVFVLLFLFTAGCKLTDITNAAGNFLGGSLGKTVKQGGNILGAFAEVFEGFSPEEEYYLGRGVAASILGSYAPLNNPAGNEYLNLLGQSLADCAAPPFPLTGYHFLFFDSDDVNAFSAPGGYILVSRGLAALCDTEDELAAVLAHEIAHVQLCHGIDHAAFGKRIDSLKKAGNLTADMLLTAKGRKLLNTLYNDTVDGIVLKIVHTGYSSSDETGADKLAVQILAKAGYSPAALPKVLGRLSSRSVKRGGFGATHPAPSDRISALQVASGPIQDNPVRQKRFSLALSSLTR